VAKSISTGVEKTLEVLEKRQVEELNTSWRTMRSKLDCLLLATNVLKSNDAMRACRIIDTMTPDEREQHIATNWGPQYLEKARPMLIQIEMIERKIQKNNEEAAAAE